MCAALLRMRIHRPVAEFIRWYAPHQRQDGFVPCCVDRDGPDWIVEHDSHGQFVALVADYVAFTGDTVLLAEMWPRVQSAVACLENLIEPCGLLPISASHEGYLAHPVHSYWDDFWALRAFSDAASLADRMGVAELASEWRQRASSFRTGLFASIRQTMEQKKLDYIPGSVEWADFDPTATANAIAMLQLSPEIPAVTIHATFDKYMTDWRRKRTGDLDWTNYTPYEIRIMAALVRLGRREDALELLRFFLSDRRPVGWHQWPEIGWRDPNAPAHIGDVPHTWIGAEYLLALRSFFVWEDELRHRLVLAAGLPWEWLSGPGVRIVKMPTLYGNLTYTLRRINPDTVQFELSEMRKFPKGGVVLQPPLAHKVTRVAKLIGRRPDQHPDGFHFRTLPVRVRFHYSPDHTL
jgi:hypothetical protein